MEDSHVIHMQSSWGFFGVLDGHGGDQCSTFVARRMVEELRKGPPQDNVALKEFALRLDREFLETKQPSGSTATFVLIEEPTGADERYTLRVGNIGDSRVLLGRADGTLVEGSGTDGGVTTDHKPDHPMEKARIERTGGTVKDVMGVARVNGDLAVSRAFGDAAYKTTGGPAQEDHPVSADPELFTIRCDPTDFVVLVCDGISEGDFPNCEVIKIAAAELRRIYEADGNGAGAVDPGAAAAAVCRQALKCGSKDNLSCMVVMLGGGEVHGAETQWMPGPFTAPSHSGFRQAYAGMAGRAELTLARAVELRYDAARQALDNFQCGRNNSTQAQGPADTGTQQELEEELAPFGSGPPADLATGSSPRIEWFSNWLDTHQAGEGGGDNLSMTRGEVIEMLERNPHLRAMAESQGLMDPVSRPVQVDCLERLKEAVEANSALKWDERLTSVCGQRGRVVQDDTSDGTSQVRFPEPIQIEAWLPTCVLTDIEDESEDCLANEDDTVPPSVRSSTAPGPGTEDAACAGGVGGGAGAADQKRQRID
jgi:serine/threonine protein phosphatase PrpC